MYDVESGLRFGPESKLPMAIRQSNPIVSASTHFADLLTLVDVAAPDVFRLSNGRHGNYRNAFIAICQLGMNDAR